MEMNRAVLFFSIVIMSLISSRVLAQENIPDERYVWDHFTIKNVDDIFSGDANEFQLIDMNGKYIDLTKELKITNIIISLFRNEKSYFSAIGLNNSVNQEMLNLIKEAKSGDRFLINSIKLRDEQGNRYEIDQIEFMVP